MGMSHSTTCLLKLDTDRTGREYRMIDHTGNTYLMTYNAGRLPPSLPSTLYPSFHTLSLSSVLSPPSLNIPLFIHPSLPQFLSPSVNLAEVTVICTRILESPAV